MQETLDSLDARLARANVDPGASLIDSIKRGLMSHSLLGEARPKVGRYEILRRLGSGGMGVVYAGRDEELDRTIAIKLLHQRTSEAARLRFAREAQGLARLSHPNVVQIYEIGEHHGASFIAMEFVDGRTLKAWAAQTNPSWRAVLKVLTDAGRGLAAAHHKRLVHRDFKPDNVMVDEEGRVRVMDFGLVQAETKLTESEAGDFAALSGIDHRVGAAEVSSVSPMSDSLTQTGSVLGTPAYMAPEQFSGLNTDARSDQFSFCVTAWELLYGQRPFSGTHVAQLFTAISEGRCDEPPPETEVPGWVRKVIVRGLAANPADRWPSMDALLDALARDPSRRRRAWLAGGGVVTLALAVWAGLALQAERERDATRAACAAEAEAIATRWNPEHEAELAGGFAATKLAFADESWARTHASLDAYAREWASLRETSCVEARVDHTRSPEQLASIVECLDEARTAFDATLDVLATADAGLVAHAGALPSELPSLAACVDERALVERVSPPEAVADQVADLRARLEHIRALHRSARYPSALELAHALVRDAEAVGWARFEAEALLALAEQQHSLAQFDDAAATGQLALRRAAEARDDALSLRGITKLARVIGYDLARTDEGLVWVEAGAVFVARLAAEDSVAAALLLNEKGNILGEASDPTGAIAEYEQALTTLERELGANHPHVAVVLHNLGGQHFMLSQLDAAAVAVERSLAIREQIYGPNHPIVADSLATLGTIRDEQTDYPEARRLHRRALEIRRVALGPEHPRVASSLLALGVLDIYAADYEQARGLIEQALAIQEQASGPDHPRVAGILDYMAAIDARTGALDQAVVWLDRALAIREAALGTEHPMYAHNLANVAELNSMRGENQLARTQLEQALAINLKLLGPDHREVAVIHERLGAVMAELGDLDGGVREAARAVELLEATLGLDHPDLGKALFLLGTIELERGHASEAVEALGRAIEIEIVTRQGSGVLGTSAFTYAHALWAAGERTKALEWAQQAADRHRADAETEALAEVEAWLVGRR